MSRMARLELVGLVLLACSQILTEQRDFYGPRNQYGHRAGGAGGGGGHHHHGTRTREVHVKYGRLRGSVVQPRADNLQLVDVFLGVPYAEPPVGQYRFEPPKTQTPWTGVRHFVSFAPVCPQVLPNLEEAIDNSRHQYLKRLLPYLQNQSEDCLYLNIYVPHQNNSQRGNLERYPVIVFIHGESYEWNSGNPYDGSVLAAYGSVVFVTVNFRLGILGFLRPGTKDDTASNFGLLDQIAALAWLKDNIGQFGGDPASITLLGHGTGAVFVNLLLLSPIEGLFKRAILMSGSALNPDAIGKGPLQITKQVAYALNCPQVNDEVIAACLKSRPVQDLLSVKIHKPKYVPAFAPLVDSAVIPDKPANLMKNTDRLARFDLMYGVTELEKFQTMPGVALLEGLSDSGRDEFIRDSVKASHELEPDLILRKVLGHYDQSRPVGMDEYEWNRDLALEVVSDSNVLAPLVAMADLHSRVNPKSYMYVFSHMRSIRDKSGLDYQIKRTLTNEELPYILGVPLDGEGYHLSAPYDKGEALLSKAMMDWWCNFAYSGNPNSARPPPRRMSYLREEYKPSSPYHIDWPEYDLENQTYFNLTTPPQLGRRYRAAEMAFWNEAIQRMLRRPKLVPESVPQQQGGKPAGRQRADGARDGLDREYGNGSGDGAGGGGGAASVPANVAVDGPDNGTAVLGNEAPSNLGEDGKEDKTDKSKEDEGSDGSGGGAASRNSSAVSLVIGFGVVFLLINATALLYLYHKRQRMRKKAANIGNLLATAQTRGLGAAGGGGGGVGGTGHQAQDGATALKRSKGGKAEQARELGYCNSASKPDIRELIKNDKAYDNNSNFGRRSRENSSSTIDTRTKVREWIQQEIVQSSDGSQWIPKDYEKICSSHFINNEMSENELNPSYIPTIFPDVCNKSKIDETAALNRCSPRFLRKTRETLQREHREKLMKQQQQPQDEEDEDEEEEEEARQRDDRDGEPGRSEDEAEAGRRHEEALYGESRQIRVRPGVRTSDRQRQQQQQQQQQQPPASKVSVAVDATPAARTASVIDQIPIELARVGRAGGQAEYLDSLEDLGTVLGTSEYCEAGDFRARPLDPATEPPREAGLAIVEHHHSRSDPLPMDRATGYGPSKAASSSARINESDSGSASSLYAKINPRTKSRLPVHRPKHPLQHHQQQPPQPTPTELELRSQAAASSPPASSNLPRLLTFGSPPPAPPVDVNVTSREAGPAAAAAAESQAGHEEALRTIRRRNYPKVLPDIEKRRSLPPNTSFVVVGVGGGGGGPRHRQQTAAGPTPPSPPPRIYSTSRSLDRVEDRDEDEAGEDAQPVTTILHVGPLRKKPDSPKNQSVPSLTEAAAAAAEREAHRHLSSSASLPVCPVHGPPRELPPVPTIPGARSEPRIVIAQRTDAGPEAQQQQQQHHQQHHHHHHHHQHQQYRPTESTSPARGVDQPDCPLRAIPERATKLPRIIIKPSPPPHTGSLPRSQQQHQQHKRPQPSLQDNEQYRRLLARREKMPLPGESRTLGRTASYGRGEMGPEAAAATKL